MTNLEKFQRMTAEELAELIVGGISRDTCDYCIHKENCPADETHECLYKYDEDPIIEFLKSEAPKKTYTVTIQEKVAQDFKVEATTADEALDIAMNKYRSGEFVLEPGELLYKEIAISQPDDEETNFEEF